MDLSVLCLNKYNLIITRFTPQLKANSDNDDEESKKIALNENRNVYIGKKLVYQVKITNPASIKSFQKLFINKMDSGEVLKRFYRDYDLKTKADIDDMMNEKERLDYLKTWEFIGNGLYEIY